MSSIVAPAVLGIDPGVTGGIAFYFPTNPGHIVAEDIPNAGGEVDVDTLATRLEQMLPNVAYIERAAAMPARLHGRTQGVSSTFKFGQAYGALKACCTVLGIPVVIVHSLTWKKHFKLTSDKEQSRALAIRLWPGAGCFSRKGDHGRAEAALIARYGADLSFPQGLAA